jgi:hypothetical protein
VAAMSAPSILLTFPELPACLAIMLACALRGLIVPRDGWRTNWVILAAAVQVPMQIIVAKTLDGLSLLRPLKYDLYVYRIDAHFGQPSFFLGRLAALHPWFRDLMLVGYSQLVVMMILAFASCLWLRPKPEAIRALIAFAITFPAAVPLYLLLPVCGPGFAFPGFPFIPPAQDLVPRPIALADAPNGFPSIHMASAILVFWYLRRWRWGQITGTAFLVLTALATMATGQHYFVDLIFAVPYALAMVYLAALLLPQATKLCAPPFLWRAST